MSIKLETRTVFACKCQRCGHEWDTLVKPKRCAGCKYRSWNGEDHRFRDPYTFKEKHYSKKKGQVPFEEQIATGTEVPVNLQAIDPLGLLTKVKAIIDRLIQDNPCDHDHDICVCEEKKVLRQIERQIKALKMLRGGISAIKANGQKNTQKEVSV